MQQFLSVVLTGDAASLIQEVQKSKQHLSTIPEVSKSAGKELEGLGNDGKAAGEKIAAGTTKATKTLGELQAQYKRFQQGLNEAKSDEGIIRINKALEATKTRIDAIKNLKPIPSPISPDTERIAKRSGQALNDVSRIIQDLPYAFTTGFGAIANNINPALESFQRVKAEAGSTKAALGSMVTGLAGPMGLGVAVAATSSLLVAFGDELLDSGEDVKKFDADVAALNTRLESSKAAFEELEDSTNFLNKLGSINIEIGGFGKVLDLQGQSVTNSELIGAAVEREIYLQGELAKAYDLMVSKRKEKRSAIFGEFQGFEENEEAKQAYDNAEKELAEHQKKLGELRNNGRIIYRQIAKQKLDDEKEANEKSAKEVKEAADKLRKYLEERQRILIEFRGKFGNISVPFPKFELPKNNDELRTKLELELMRYPYKAEVDVTFVPKIINPENGINAFLETALKQGEKTSFPLPDFKTEEARQKLLVNYQGLFKNLGSQLPKTIKIEGLSLDVNDMAIPVDTLKNKLQEALQIVQSQVQAVGSLIDSTLTPSIQSFFSAIASNRSPMLAFFDTMKQQIIQLVAQAVTAQIKLLALKLFTGAATGGTSLLMGGRTFSALSALPSIGGGIAAPTGLGGGGVIDMFSRMNNLAFAGSKASNVVVSGDFRLDGNDLVASFSNTSRNKRSYF